MMEEVKQELQDVKTQLALQNHTLGTMCSCVERIDKCLTGNGKPGLILEVDRLKRARKTHNAVLWVLFTTIAGAIASTVGVILSR